MARHHIKKGLTLPIAGAPRDTIDGSVTCSSVALLAADYHGMKPRMHVAEGDTVKRGQVLFEDSKTPGVFYTAPGAGRVAAIHRGERRALQSLVITLSDAERAGNEESVSFKSYAGKEPKALSRDDIVALLVESGMWTALRTRPFSRVPSPSAQPSAVFITACDTAPHAPSVDAIAQARQADFQRGVSVVAKLSAGKTFVCVTQGSSLRVEPDAGVELHEFSGKHPAGTVGVHIHTLAPAGRQRTVWHLGYQDVIAIGALFATGKLDVSRVISIAGPGCAKPSLVKTRLGARTEDIIKGYEGQGELRVVSGSVLAGRKAMGEVEGYLGRYHNQIALLPEGRERKFLGWLTPGFGAFSTVPIYMSAFARSRVFSMTTSTNGSARAMVPIGMYERVMPMDIMPTFLLRSLLVGDVERAEQLGALELDEEDLALCTFVCPGKHEYGPLLRKCLTQIEKEG